MKALILSLALGVIIYIGAFLSRYYGWYNTYWFTDISLHFISGIMFGSFWFWLIRKINKPNLTLEAITTVTFAGFGSILWEFWEYAGWRIKPDHTRYYIPEIADSLNDTLCALLGALVVVIVILISHYLSRANRTARGL